MALVLEDTKRSLLVRTVDYFLYFATFGGITFIAGSIVHALTFSLSSIAFLLSGLVMYIAATIIRDRLSLQEQRTKTRTFETYLVAILTAVGAGVVSGGILHWQEGPRFGLYLVISGLALSVTSNLLYGTDSIKKILREYVLNLSMFAGISFISGSVAHAMNSWFTNYGLVLIGLVLTPGAAILKQKYSSGGLKGNTLKNMIILVLLSLGIGGITGGVLHFSVNIHYAVTLIAAGFGISYFAALLKTDGSLVDLRK